MVGTQKQGRFSDRHVGRANSFRALLPTAGLAKHQPREPRIPPDLALVCCNIPIRISILASNITLYDTVLPRTYRGISHGTIRASRSLGRHELGEGKHR